MASTFFQFFFFNFMIMAIKTIFIQIQSPLVGERQQKQNKSKLYTFYSI